MTITKKTRLIKALKRVSINTASIDKDGSVVIVGDNLDGTSRYGDDGTIATVRPKITKTASGESEEPTLGRLMTEDPHQYTGSLYSLHVDPGDELTITFEVNPAKPEFEPGTLSKTVIVSAD